MEVHTMIRIVKHVGKSSIKATLSETRFKNPRVVSEKRPTELSFDFIDEETGEPFTVTLHGKQAAWWGGRVASDTAAGMALTR
jgi:hypothetical protein